MIALTNHRTYCSILPKVMISDGYRLIQAQAF